MKITYSITGEKRKALVSAISQELKTPAKYLGAPTFAYEVGSYRVDRDGTLTGEDNRGLVNALQTTHGLSPASVKYDTEAETPEANETNQLVVDIPLTGFTPEKLDNLSKLVNAKAPLLKAALGADDLPIQQVDDKLRFPWFQGHLTSEAVLAYTTLVSKLCEAAREKKRVTAKECVTDNPKYAMRCWLLSLGLTGDEYKTARKILLARLDGNSAFRYGRKADEKEQEEE
jgi:hypothetical protein